MNAGPYSNETVHKFLKNNFIPLRSQCYWDNPTELMKQFHIKWTPTLMVLDKRGMEHHRMVGYLPVDDLIAHLRLGIAMMYFNGDHLIRAAETLKTLIEMHPNAAAAAEAVYYLGVVEYKKEHDAPALRRAYDTLKEKYPHSEWCRRAEPYLSIPYEQPYPKEAVGKHNGR